MAKNSGGFRTFLSECPLVCSNCKRKYNLLCWSSLRQSDINRRHSLPHGRLNTHADVTSNVGDENKHRCVRAVDYLCE